jgi:hypothetical protein
MKDIQRHVLCRGRVQLPEARPADGSLALGSLTAWCLASSGDISVEIPLSIKLSATADDGPVIVQVSKAFQKEAVAVAMRSGDVQAMRAVAEMLEHSAVAEDFKSDISILLQLAQDFEDRREDVYMNSLQMAQECSNNRSMQSAPRFAEFKSAICSPSITSGSFQAQARIEEQLSLKSGSSSSHFPSPSPHPYPYPHSYSHHAVLPFTEESLAATVRSQPLTPDAAPSVSGVFSSLLSSIRGVSSSIFGSSSSNHDEE